MEDCRDRLQTKMCPSLVMTVNPSDQTRFALGTLFLTRISSWNDGGRLRTTIFGTTTFGAVTHVLTHLVTRCTKN